MSNNESKSSKLIGSSEYFANFLREMIDDVAEKAADKAVAKVRVETTEPLMGFIKDTRSELKKDYEVLNQNMNARFLEHGKQIV